MYTSWASNPLQYQSSPLLHTLPDLQSVFPIVATPHHLHHSPSAFLFDRRRSQAKSPKPARTQQPNTKVADQQRPARSRTLTERIFVDGRRQESFDTAVDECRFNHIVRVDRSAGIDRISTRLSSIDVTFRTAIEQLNKVHPPTAISVQERRDVAAACLNSIIAILPKAKGQGNLIVSVFRQMDCCLKTTAAMAHVKTIRSEQDQASEKISLRSTLRELERKLEALENEKRVMKEDMAILSDLKAKAETDLELYRKYVWVKTGKLTLDWGKLIPNGDLPTVHYMKKEHQTRAALIQAAIQAEEYTPNYGDHDEDEEGSGKDRDLAAAINKNAMSDMCDDLWSRSEQISAILRDSDQKTVDRPAETTIGTKTGHLADGVVD